MRTDRSIKNVITNILNMISISLLRFISRTIFIKVLGEVFLGVNGLFSNVLGILTLADLGISSAISFSLYKPLKDNNTEKLKSLMAFYKKAYYIIAFVIFVIGMGLMPFLNYFIEDTLSFTMNQLYLYYFVFLMNMVLGYLLSYRRTLIIADQKEYKITYFVIAFSIVSTISQIIVLLIFKNYIVYLFTQIFIGTIENFVINKYIDKEYKFLKEKNVRKLSKTDLSDIKIKIKGLIFHKIGSYFVDSTDNLIISKYLGLKIVGIYSNYYLLLSMINSLLNTALWSIVSSVGNLNISVDDKKKYSVYKTLNFIDFSIICVCTICFYNLFNYFIGHVWLDSSFLLSNSVVLLLCINFYVSGLMHFNDAIKSSVGIYNEDKLVPVFQSIINIVFSVVLVKSMGILGVFIGTLISSIIPTIVKPIIIFKKVYKENVLKYFLSYFIQLIVVCLSVFVSSYLITLLPVMNKYIGLVVYLLISIVVPITIILLFYSRSEPFKDLINRLKFIKEKRGLYEKN